MKRLKTYVASYSTRGTQSMLIHNCASAKEAREKLMAWRHGGQQPDVDPMGHEIDRSYAKSAKFRVDENA